METNTLNKLGLNDNEVIVYEELLKSGQQKASQIAQKTPLKRGLIYKTLEGLEKKGLVIREDEDGSVSIFSPIHPNILKGLAEKRAQEALEVKESIQKELGSLISMYNLANNKPGVEFYEGVEGIEKALNDTLTSKTDIYTFADKRSIESTLSTLNKTFRRKIIKSGIHKKIIVPFSDKELYKNTDGNNDAPNIERRFIKGDIPLFKTGMQIYDNKVSFQTITENNQIAILITDPHIFQMHKIMFEYIWNTLE